MKTGIFFKILYMKKTNKNPTKGRKRSAEDRDEITRQMVVVEAIRCMGV